MGYNTRFTGVLAFKATPDIHQLTALSAFFREDPRDHPEWNPPKQTGYIDLRITKDFTGIEWDSETEKTYYLENSVNIVLDVMRRKWPDFGLTGSLLAQGEDIEDRWELHIGDDGRAHKRPIAITGQRVTCPHCRSKFVLEGTTT